MSSEVKGSAGRNQNRVEEKKAFGGVGDVAR